MKSIAIIATLLLLFLGVEVAQGQGVTPPQSVQSAFSQKFPNVGKTSWEKESDNEWEAGFKVKGVKYAAIFDGSGNWLATEHEIKKKDLPAKVMSTIQSQFAGYSVEEQEIVETPAGKSYEVELKKGKEKWEVLIDAAGNVVKKEMEESDEKEDGDDEEKDNDNDD